MAWTDGNGVSTVAAYDAATGAPVGISTDSEINGKQVVDQLLTYTWDGYGNLAQRCDANRSLAENVADDDLNRFTGSTVYTGVSVSGNTCAGGSATNTLSASYDAMGNILSKSNVGSTYKYDPNHPYAVDTVQNSSGTTVYSASYDNDGNMTTRNGSLIQWSVDNLPTSIASGTNYSTFSYDPDHDRYYQSATFNGVTTDTTYVGGLFEVVSSVGSTEYRHNIMADGQVIAVHTITSSGAATTSYLHYDHLGSVDTITDDGGNVIQSMSFDAFGLRRDASNWDYDLNQNQIAALKDDTDRGYTFQEQLDNVGLIHMNGRVYDPVVGRFISADPTISQPFFSQGFNRYAYVDNSPLENTDPSGFLTLLPPCDDSTITCGGGGGGGDSGSIDTGSMIPGVDTGAECYGDCAGVPGYGPGPTTTSGGSGNGSGASDTGGGGATGGGGGNSTTATNGGSSGSTGSSNLGTGAPCSSNCIGKISVLGSLSSLGPLLTPGSLNTALTDTSLTLLPANLSADQAARLMENIKKHSSVGIDLNVAGALGVGGKLSIDINTNGISLSANYFQGYGLFAGGFATYSYGDPEGWTSTAFVEGGAPVAGMLNVGYSSIGGAFGTVGIGTGTGFIEGMASPIGGTFGYTWQFSWNQVFTYVQWYEQTIPFP